MILLFLFFFYSILFKAYSNKSSIESLCFLNEFHALIKCNLIRDRSTALLLLFMVDFPLKADVSFCWHMPLCLCLNMRSTLLNDSWSVWSFRFAVSQDPLISVKLSDLYTHWGLLPSHSRPPPLVVHSLTHSVCLYSVILMFFCVKVLLRPLSWGDLF